MKIFIYKTLFLSFVLLILFKITIGSAIQNIEKKIDNYFSKKNVIFIKDKLQSQIMNLDSWMQEFIRLDRIGETYDKK